MAAIARGVQRQLRGMQLFRRPAAAGSVLLLAAFVWASCSCQAEAQADNLSKDIRDVVQPFDVTGQGVVAVVMGIADDGQVAVWGQGAYGRRRFDSTAAVRVDDLFPTASAGKSFTAAVWGVLVTKGLVKWTDTIGAILKKYNVVVPGLQATYAGATITQLLQHRAGFNDDTDWTAADDAFVELIAQTPRAAAQKTAIRRAYSLYSLAEKPGAKRGAFVFSNIGYNVAAWLAELVSGKNFENQITEYFAKPLKLKVGFGLPYNQSTLEQNRATGPVGQDCTGGDLSLPVYDWQAYSPYSVGSGGLYMRVGDLATWTSWHVRGISGLLPARTYSLMSQDAFVQLHTPFEAPDADNGGDQAMGWANDSNPDQMQTDGSYAGFHTNIIGITQPDSDGNTLAIAVSTNVDDGEDGVCMDSVSAAVFTLTDNLIAKYMPDLAPQSRRRSMLDLTMGGARRRAARRQRV